MAEQAKRRDLTFDSFEQLCDEIDRLQQSGYVQNGKWNLSQICLHLVEWLRYPMDGYPPAPLPLRIIFWLMNVTIARSWIKKILTSGFSPGTPTAPYTAFKPDEAEEKEAAEKLKETIDRFMAYDGELHPSPIFGGSDRETLEKVQLMHCAHHLGFLEPKS